MAKNPKIEFYKIRLTPINEDSLTFRDLNCHIYKSFDNRELPENINDGQLMADFFRHFFFKIDGGAIVNESKRKAFKAKYSRENLEENTIHLMSERNIIYGVIKGGEFDTGKTLGVVDNPNAEERRLNRNQLITDDFYFLLYTPLDKNVGVLILQSYTRDNVTDIFKPFIENLFKLRGISNKATASIFMPEAIQNRFKRNSIVKKFVYSNRFLVNEMHEQTMQAGDFTINVEIKSHGDQINLNNLPWWKRVLGESLLRVTSQEQRQLETFNLQKGYIKANVGEGTPTKFSLNEEEIEIKPTIYLSNHINLEDNGVPLFDELHEFSLQTLVNEVMRDIYPEDFLNED